MFLLFSPRLSHIRRQPHIHLISERTTNLKPKSSSSRPRGAPRGNKNALQHGVYSRELDPADLDGFQDLNPLSLDNEIIILRVIIRRLVASSRGLTDFDRLSSLLRTLTFASLSLTRLMRTRFLIQGKSSLLADEVDDAIQELFGHRASFQDPSRTPYQDPIPGIPQLGSIPDIQPIPATFQNPLPAIPHLGSTAPFQDPIATFQDPNSPDTHHP